MSTHTLQFLAAVPVGHTVRIDRFQRAKTLGLRLFGDAGDSTACRVTDLDTGVVYGPAVLWQLEGPPGLDRLPGADIDPIWTLDSAVTGRVTACRVMSRQGNARNHRLLTRLEVTSVE
jgi:hypothetical protein